MLKGDLHQDGPQAVPEGHATPGGDLGSDSACSVEHNGVRDAAGAGGVLHRGGIHEVKTVPLSLVNAEYVRASWGEYLVLEVQMYV